MDAHQIAKENLFFYAVAGSHAYGMNTEHSDVDYRGLFYSPKNVVTSLFKNIEQVEKFDDQKDAVVYELSKFLKLLVDQNPNILELLWVDEKFIKHSTKLYYILRRERGHLLSSKAKHTFSGYAISQLKRIRGHNKWITNSQPERRPKEIDFVSVVWNNTQNKEWNKTVPFKGIAAYELGGDIYGLKHFPEYEGVWHDIHEALVAKPATKYEHKFGGFDVIVKFNQQLYKETVDNWKHYWDWRKNRNEARSRLEELHGYDTKHAAHLVRLLRMGCEILRGEGVKVLRSDAEELLSIRNGAWSYDQLVKYSDNMEAELERLYTTTKLPHTVDHDHVDNLANIIYEMAWESESEPSLKADWKIGYKYCKESS